MMKRLILVLILITMRSQVIQAQTDTSITNGFQRFKEKNGANWQIQLSEKTGIPASIHFGKTKPQPGRLPEDIAQDFLKENRSLFKMKDKLIDLKLSEVQENDIDGKPTEHVQYSQQVNGVSVEGGDFYVHLCGDGSIYMANGDYYPNLDIDTRPGITKEKAIDIAATSHNFKIAGKEIAELTILPRTQGFVLAWRITLLNEEFESWIYWINANNGTIISNVSGRYPIDSTATINCYPKHPNNSSIQTTTISHLVGDGTLTGRYAKLLGFRLNPAQLTFSGTNFILSESNYRFSEPNVYYHIDKYRSEYINPRFNFNKTFKSTGSSQIKALTHDRNSTNASYDHETGNLYFGDGEDYLSEDRLPAYHDFAKEDKVIYHEYTHAVFFAIKTSYIAYGYDEATAIAEGLADYFSGAYTGRPVIMEYSHWDERRNMEYYLPTYSDYLVSNKEPHAGGNLFSSILWNLRQTINEEYIDKLVYRAIYDLSYSPRFSDFRDKMIAEDNLLYNGVYNCQIAAAFDAKGITGTCGPTLNAAINGPTSVPQGTSGTWTAYVSGGVGGYTYEWKKGIHFDSTATLLGTNSSVSTVINNEITLWLGVHSGPFQYTVTAKQVYATPSGCPYVYTRTDQGFEADNNILHRSEFKENQNKDILDLYKLRVIPAKIDNRYVLRIKEANGDHSYFDRSGLYTVDHPTGTGIGVTEDNRVVSYRESEIEDADEISFEDGEIVSGNFEQIEGAKDEIMHVRFSKDKINRVKNSLAKVSGNGALALRIDFNRFFPSLPPKEEAAFLEAGALSLNKSASLAFARRETASPVLVPLNPETDLQDITIRWNRQFGFGQISLVPVEDISDQVMNLTLTSAVHSSKGNVKSLLTVQDRKYAEMDSTEYIDLAFAASGDPADGQVRDFIFETNGRYTAPEDMTETAVKEFGLLQNYPNPFNPSTTIRYTLKANARVTLKIYNMLGQEVRTLVDRDEAAGIKEIEWDGKDRFGKQAASGMYIYKLNAGKTVISRKMIFVK